MAKAQNAVVAPSVESFRTNPLQITLRDVTKAFGSTVVAIKNLNVEIRRGEFVAFLGASGCGKSTALRTIAGLTEPTSGTVDLHGIAREKSEIGFVFQEPTLMPWATVYENVFLPLRLKGIARSAADAPIRAALATVGLTDFTNNYPRQLSGGMKMRCSIARAVVTEPKLMLLDEPFAALDELTRQRLNDEFLSLWQQFGWTVVFVTHSVSEAAYLSNRVLVFSPRTSCVVDEIEIDVPYPRNSSLRTDVNFQKSAARLSAALHKAWGAGG